MLDFAPLVEMVARTILAADGPMCFHVDGTWGRGKTSFCKLVDGRLKELGAAEGADRLVDTAWHVASDEDGSPDDAILYAVATAATHGDAEETARVLRSWGNLGGGVNAVEARPVRRESFRRWIARELAWELDGVWMEAANQGSDGLAKELELKLVMPPAAPDLSVETRSAGDETGPALASEPPIWKLKLQRPRRRMAVVFIDDLDRCVPKRVVDVFDSLRTYVACPGVVFVVAADRVVVEHAFTEVVTRMSAQSTRRADDAMEKYIRHSIALPALESRGGFLSTRMENLQRRLFRERKFDLLRGPGSALSDGVAMGLVIYLGRSLTIRRLKRILNEFTLDIARAADALALTDADLGAAYATDDALYSNRTLARTWPVYGDDLPAKREQFAAFFCGRLIRIVIEHLWPELMNGTHSGSQVFNERVNALIAIGREPAKWSDPILERIVAVIAPVPDEAKSHTPLAVARDVCLFAAAVADAFVEREFTATPPVTPATGAQPSVAEDYAQPAESGSSVTPAVPTVPPPAVAAGADPGAYFADLRAKLSQFPGEGAPDVLRTVHRTLSLDDPHVDVDDLLDHTVAMIRQIWDQRQQGLCFQAALEVAREARDTRRFEHARVILDTMWKWPLPPEMKKVLVGHFLDLMTDDEFPSAGSAAYLVDELLRMQLEPGPDHARAWAAVGALLSKGKLLHPAVNYESIARVAENYRAHLEQTWTGEWVDFALGAVDIVRRTAIRLPDVVNQIAQRLSTAEADPRFLKLRVDVADALVSQGDPGSLQSALEIYSSLEGTDLWTPEVLHNLATLTIRVKADAPRAGRLWELAYRTAGKDARIQRAFSQLLKQLGDRQADAVTNGRPLPDDWHPFGTGFKLPVLPRKRRVQ